MKNMKKIDELIKMASFCMILMLLFTVLVPICSADDEGTPGDNNGDGDIVDPGDDSEYLSSKLSDLNLKPVSIVATHGHFDHILAVADLKLIYNIPFLCAKKDEFLVKSMKSRAKRWLERDIFEQNPTINKYLKDFLKTKDFNIKLLSTPGHTPGGVCLYLKEENILFSGDVIFANGNVGRYDLSYSNKVELEKSVQMILNLPGKTKIFPGHGVSTYVRKEKENWNF